MDANDSVTEVLTGFVTQYYLDKPVPKEIIFNAPINDTRLIEQVLSEQAGHKVRLAHRTKTQRGKWLELAVQNVDYHLQTRLSSQLGMAQRREALALALALEAPPERIECFDISHTGGEATVASCVVFGAEGAQRSEYRRFNIKGVAEGDDYAALQQAVQRRYTRVIRSEAKLPDLILIDGGRGQINAVQAILTELQLNDIPLFGVSKGADRKMGQETLHPASRSKPLYLQDDSPALHLIQQVRDEAHRFAISGHRHKRQKKRTRSVLEDIAGMGPKRRQMLLKQFGGMQQLERASVEDLASVKGISDELAQKVYDALHPQIKSKL